MTVRGLKYFFYFLSKIKEWRITYSILLQTKAAADMTCVVICFWRSSRLFPEWTWPYKKAKTKQTHFSPHQNRPKPKQTSDITSPFIVNTAESESEAISFHRFFSALNRLASRGGQPNINKPLPFRVFLRPIANRDVKTKIKPPHSSLCLCYWGGTGSATKTGSYFFFFDERTKWCDVNLRV